MRLLLIFFVCFHSIANSQNLVKNGDFEEYAYILDKNFNRDYFFAEGWRSANSTYIDFFSTEIDTIKYPNCRNKFDHIVPFSGKSCIGLFPLTWDGEMRQVTGILLEPLKKDSIYRVTFNLCFGGSKIIYALKRFEIKFSESPMLYKESITLFGNISTDYKSLFKDNKIMADLSFDISKLCENVSWCEYSSLYKAKGNERYLTFGVFFQNTHDLISDFDHFLKIRSKGLKAEERFYLKNKNSYIFITNPMYISNSFIGQHSPFYFLDNVVIEKVN